MLYYLRDHSGFIPSVCCIRRIYFKHRLIYTCLRICTPKFPQSHESQGLFKLILDPFRPTYAERRAKFGEILFAVKPPELPCAVAASERFYNSSSSRMVVNKFCAVVDNVVYYDPQEIVPARLRDSLCFNERQSVIGGDN
jgi:hypothetical protein